MLVFQFLAGDYSRVISELEPVDRIKQVECETKLTVLLSFNVLNGCTGVAKKKEPPLPKPKQM